jgi:hypothetical protein
MRPEHVLVGEHEPEEIDADGKPKRKPTPAVEWAHIPRERKVVVPLASEGRVEPIVVPESAAEQRRGGGLILESHSRIFQYATTEGGMERVRALTVFLVNRRYAVPQSLYADVSYAFRARLELGCPDFIPGANSQGSRPATATWSTPASLPPERPE